MYANTMGFGGAIVALWRGQRLGRKVWPDDVGIKLQMLEGGQFALGYWPVGATVIEREWHPTTPDVLANDWYVHNDSE